MERRVPRYSTRTAIGVAIGVALVWLVASVLPGHQRSTTDAAAQTLKARLARGEITEAEYEQARRLIWDWTRQVNDV